MPVTPAQINTMRAMVARKATDKELDAAIKKWGFPSADAFAAEAKPVLASTPDMPMSPWGPAWTPDNASVGRPATPKHVNPIEGGLVSLAQGATLGTLDNIIAGVKAGGDYVGGKPFGESYDKRLIEEKGLQDSFHQDHPHIDTGLGLAGSLAAPLGPLAKIGTTAKGASLGTRVLGSAKSGAAMGALGGALNAEGGLEDRAKAGLLGAGLGGLAGGVLPAAGAAFRGTRQLGADLAGLENPNYAKLLRVDTQAQKAEKLALGDLVGGGANPSALGPGSLQGQNELMRGQGLEPTLADLSASQGGRQAVSRADAAMRIPNSETSRVRGLMDRRKDMRPGEIANAMAEGTTDLPGEVILDQLRKIRSANAQPLYDAAYKAGEKGVVGNKTFDELLKRPAFAKAIKKAEELALNQGKTLTPPPGPQLFGPSGQALPQSKSAVGLEHLDYIKKSMDDAVLGTRGANIVGNEKMALLDARKEFVDAIDNAFPSYKAARSKYAGDSAVITAFEEAPDIAKMSFPAAKANIDKFFNTDSEKEHLLLGLTANIREKVLTHENGSTGYLTKNPDLMKTMEYLFKNKTDYGKFMQKLRSQETMGSVERQLAQGSQTAERAQFGKDFGRDLWLTKYGGLNKAGETIRNRTGSAQAAKYLDVMANPDNTTSALDALTALQQKMAADAKRRKFAPGLLGLGVGSAIGNQFGGGGR